MKYILGRTSASIGGIFLKIQVLHRPRMRYKLYKFGCVWSIYKGNLLGEHGATASISQILSQFLT